MPACKAIPNQGWDLEEMKANLKMLQNPAENIPTIYRNSVMSGDLLIEVAKNAVGFYKEGNFEKFGVAAGMMLRMLTVNEKPAMLGATEKAEKAKEIAEMLQGFLKATDVGTFNFTNLLICIYEADQDAMGLYAAVSLFEQAWADKEIMEAVGGAIFTVAAVQEFRQQVLPICEQVDQKGLDWDHYDAIMAKLWDMKTKMHVEGDDVIFNGENITTDFTSAFDSLEDEEYGQFGEKLGQTLDAAASKTNMFIF